MAREKFLKIKLNWKGISYLRASNRYVIVRSFEVFTHFLSVIWQITLAPYNSNIDLAIQTLSI